MEIIPLKKKLQKEMLWAVKLIMSIKIIFKSKLVSKQAKLKLYWTMKSPVIKYAIEMWVLKESMK